MDPPTPATSSSGYITEFNRDTGNGLIQEETTKRILPIRACNFKRKSKRYLTDDKQYVGELFDFNIIAKQNSTGTDDNSDQIFEAVNIRHRVLKCNIEGCPRVKAFTHVKALEDHIYTRHTLKKIKEETTQSSSVPVKQPKKQRPEPIKITLSSNVTNAVIGRFIGKQGVNLKRCEQEFKVQLKLLNTWNTSNALEILVKPKSRNSINVLALRKKLEFEWKLCVRDQLLHEDIHKQRLQLSSSYSQTLSWYFDVEKDSRYRENTRSQFSPSYSRTLSWYFDVEKDSRYRENTRFTRARQLKQEEFRQKRLRRQTEPSVRIQQPHASLYQEGHRSIAVCDAEYRLKSNFDYHQPKKTKKTVKNKQWLVKQELRELE